MDFSEVSVESLSINPFTKIGTEWMLVTSGDMNSWNTIYLGQIEKVLSSSL